ncbi:T9SS type A sorting domain-containing protein [Parabacteroides sp. PF5-6]|uniref:InlB B-repeat-containing protein n=1 Tax=Parabacteroides sp. PF5-6 TaxID=1742403 RepID=UPI00240565EB|nr:T9SS type A sorting domain-containing protein [Parabacteroides sp. PF5-6]MDF9829983.1 hypothetical protein [Parabacteroides sp. PF5-6]
MKQKLLFSLLALLVSVGVVSAQGTSNPKANEWVDVYGMLKNQGELTADKLTYKFKKEGDTSFSSATTYTTANTTYKGQFQFYTSSKGFQNGKFICQATGTGNYSEEVEIIVEKAEFSASLTANPTEGGNINFQKITSTVTSTKMEEGDAFIMIAEAARGYTFKNFTLSGIQAVSGKPNEYIAKGNAVSLKNISAVANFTANTYGVSWNVEEGSGNGTVSVTVDDKAISSGTKVTTGKEVVITLNPNASYTARLVTADDVELKLENNVYTTTVVDEALSYKIYFEQTGEPTITFKANANVTGFDINGTASSYVGSELTPEKGFTVGSTVVISKIAIADKFQLDKVLLNTTELTLTTPTSFSFKMPANNANITFVTKAATAAIEVTPVADPDKGVTVDGEAQKQEYDGSAKPFKYDVAPSGLTGFTVTYSLTDVTNFISTVPASIGNYKVKVTRAADDTYAAVNKVFDMEITKGKPVITTIPTVTINSAKTAYVISGGVAKTKTGKTLSGVWSAGDFNAEAKSVAVTFTAQASGKTDENYLVSDAVTVGVGSTNYTLTYPTVPTGMTFSAKQGDVVLKSGSKIHAGIKIDLSLEWVAGYTDVTIQENKAGATPIFTVNNDVLKGTGTIAAADVKGSIELKFIYSGSASPEVTLDWALATGAADGKTTPYTGSTIESTKLFALSDFTFTGVSELSEIDKKNIKITYKQGSNTLIPMNAGKYTVSVEVAAFTTEAGYRIKKSSKDFTDALEVTKKELNPETEITKPELAYVAPGQKLANALFVGGAAPVVGVFQFVDGDVTPKDGGKYAVKFVPADKNNYAEVELGDGKLVEVSITNTRVLIIDTPVNGTIKVVGNDNKTYTTGMELPGEVTALTVTATPATGYALATLTVNGSTLASGGTFTIGTANTVEVKATFSNASSYKVDLEIPRGVQLISKSGETVAAGKNFTFTLATAAGDVPTVRDEDGEVIEGEEGVYTLEKVMKNKTITVTLTSPTELTVKVTQTPTGNGVIEVENLSGLRADTYYYGDTLRLTATMKDDYRLLEWWDGSEENPRLFVVTEDVEISASFKYTVGIEPIEGVDVRGGEGYIYVSAPGEVTVTVVNMNGRAQKVRVNGEEYIRELPAGIYGIVVEQGNKASRAKVVVR